jgi:hypothetical protein
MAAARVPRISQPKGPTPAGSASAAADADAAGFAAVVVGVVGAGTAAAVDVAGRVVVLVGAGVAVAGPAGSAGSAAVVVGGRGAGSAGAVVRPGSRDRVGSAVADAVAVSVRAGRDVASGSAGAGRLTDRSGEPADGRAEGSPASESQPVRANAVLIRRPARTPAAFEHRLWPMDRMPAPFRPFTGARR